MIVARFPDETESEREKRLAKLKAVPHPTYLKEGKRVYTDTTGPGFKQGWISWLVAITSMTLVACWFHIMLTMILFAWIPWVRNVLILMTATVLIPANVWDGFKRSFIVKSWRQYMNYSVIVEHVLRKNDPRGHLFCCFPHGVLAFAWMAASGTDQYFFPDRDMYGLSGSSVSYIPLFRHISAWLGGIPATKQNIRTMLKRGRTVALLMVGGMVEMFYTSKRDVEQIKLQNRRGFVRLAVSGGHTLVPMYYFGQSQLLTLWSPKFLSYASRKLGFTIGFLYGRFCLPIPRPIPCMGVSGTPIDCGPPMSSDDPKFNERVEELHAKFAKAIKKLFDDYKGEYGWAHKELIIV